MRTIERVISSLTWQVAICTGAILLIILIGVVLHRFGANEPLASHLQTPLTAAAIATALFASYAILNTPSTSAHHPFSDPSAVFYPEPASHNRPLLTRHPHHLLLASV